jgi:myo-inositol 2-dehydrogenase/D-chiro-inositol 1-dehydrogenase
MGSGHARYLTEHVFEAEVTALADVDLERAKQLSYDLKTPKLITNNVQELCFSELVDAIIIASPDSQHAAHLRLAISSSKPTLCEKPIATISSLKASIASISCLECAGFSMLSITLIRKRMVFKQPFRISQLNALNL